MAVPVLMYGSENWPLYRSDKRKIEAADMRFLRPTAGYTLWDKKRSIDIREQLEMFNINEKLMQYKINWRKQIQRLFRSRAKRCSCSCSVPNFLLKLCRCASESNLS